MTDEQLHDIVGRLADKADNFLHFNLLPLESRLRNDGLVSGLKEIRDELREAFIDRTGENPWEEQ